MYFWKHNKYYDAPSVVFTSCHGFSTITNLDNLAEPWHSDLGHCVDNTSKQILTSCNISDDCHRHNVCCAC